MKKFMNWFAGEESGQSMVEYGLIIGLVAVVLIGMVAGIGTTTKDKVFEKVVLAIMSIR